MMCIDYNLGWRPIYPVKNLEEDMAAIGALPLGDIDPRISFGQVLFSVAKEVSQQIRVCEITGEGY